MAGGVGSGIGGWCRGNVVCLGKGSARGRAKRGVLRVFGGGVGGSRVRSFEMLCFEVTFLFQFEMLCFEVHLLKGVIKRHECRP